MPTATKKKTYNLDEALIHDARRVLEARTDTEAIQRALRKVVEDAEIEQALDALLREGRFRTVFR
jgi:Arc/MetJ family transcription regulator